MYVIKATLLKIYVFYSNNSNNFLSLRLERIETLKYHCVCRPPFGKVKYSKQRPWRHAKVRSLIKFTDHHTPDTINGFRYPVLVYKMQKFRAFISFSVGMQLYKAIRSKT